MPATLLLFTDSRVTNLTTLAPFNFIVIDLSDFHSLFHLQPLIKPKIKFIGRRIDKGITAGQSYRGVDRKKGNFHDLTYFSTWMDGIFWDTGCYDKIIKIHEIKIGSYR